MTPRHLPQLVYTWSSVLPNGKGFGVVGSSTSWRWTTNPLDRELHPWMGFLEPEQIPSDTTGLTGVEVVPEHPFGLLVALHRYVGADGMGRSHRHVTVVVVDASRELSTADALTWAEQALPEIDWPLQQPVAPDLPDLTIPQESMAPSHTETDPSLVTLLLQTLPRRERIVLPGDAVAPAQLAAALEALPAGFTREASISTFPTADWDPTITLAPRAIPSPQARRPSSPTSHLDPRDDCRPDILALSARYLRARIDNRPDDAIADLDTLQVWVERVERTATAPAELTDTELIDQAMATETTVTRRDACLAEISDRTWAGRWSHQPQRTPAMDRIGDQLAGRIRAGESYAGDRFELLRAWGQGATARELALDAAANPPALTGFTKSELANVGRDLNAAAADVDIDTLTAWLTHPTITAVIGHEWCPARERLIRHLLEPKAAPSARPLSETGHRFLVECVDAHPQHVARVLSQAKTSPGQIHELIAKGSPDDLVALLRVLAITDLTWLPRDASPQPRPATPPAPRAPLPSPVHPNYLGGAPPHSALANPYLTPPASTAQARWFPKPEVTNPPSGYAQRAGDRTGMNARTTGARILTALVVAAVVVLLIILPRTAALIIFGCITISAVVAVAGNRRGGRPRGP